MACLFCFARDHIGLTETLFSGRDPRSITFYIYTLTHTVTYINGQQLLYIYEARHTHIDKDPSKYIYNSATLFPRARPYWS